MSSFQVHLKTPKPRDLQSEYSKPKNLKEFGYEYDKEGFLIDSKTKEYFQWKGQEHYDWLGDHVARYIQDEVLIKRFKLEEYVFNKDSKDPDHHVNVFHSKNIMKGSENKEKRKVLLFLITGTGTPKAGQWAMSLCINGPKGNKEVKGGLEVGSMKTYLERAEKRGFEVLISNPNKNFTKLSKPIPSHKDPIEHNIKVYDQFVKDSKVDDIVIVAHSFGGVSVISGLLTQRSEILSRLRCVAFCDSVHTTTQTKDLTDKAVTFLKEHSINWIQSYLDLDKFEGITAGVKRLSSGHSDHVWTSYSAQDSVFKFIDNELNSLEKK